MRIQDGEIFDAESAGIGAGPAMNFLETFRTGLEAVVTHRLRSSLTVLGIMIGIAAVILTVGLGEGAQQQVSSEITALGSNLLDHLPREHDLELGDPGRVRLGLHPDHGRRHRPGVEDGGARHRRGGADHDRVGDPGGRDHQLDHHRGRHRPVVADGPGPLDDRGTLHRRPRRDHPGRRGGARARPPPRSCSVAATRSARPVTDQRCADVGHRRAQHGRFVGVVVDDAPTRTIRPSCPSPRRRPSCSAGPAGTR